MWDAFNQRHESRDSAFEALCCQLFERWCRREYGDSIRSFYFVDGRGGDGGVEAFVILNDDSVVGLQAKAWWDGFGRSQKTQIESSLRAATNRHQTLVRYVVCCPLNLLPARGAGNSGTSQLDRWQNFEAEIKIAYPDVTLQYEGKTGIEEWLQQPDSETIRAYWFDGEVIPRDHWRQQFDRVMSAWMDLRYVPDLHVSTSLEENLSWFANAPLSARELKAEIAQLADRLKQKRERISNLGNLPGQHSPQALSDCATLVNAIDFSLAALQLLRSAAESQHLPAIDVDSSIDDQVRKATSRLEEELGGRDRLSFASSPTQSVLKALNGLEELLDSVREMVESQKLLRRVLIVLGEAGTGKTQTISKLCDTASGEGNPVLVLPARAYNPNDGWNVILGKASNRPGWTADQILDALEASSLYAWRESPEPRSAPRRAILALDGPDESPVPKAWGERLKELADLCKSRPLIAPIVMARLEADEWMPMGDERFFFRHFYASEFAGRLPDIFEIYVQAYEITVSSPAGIAWALRTPLAIRIFTEIYQGRTIAPGQDLVTTLAALFQLKLKRLDGELNHRNPSWPNNRELSLRVLRALVPAFLANGKCAYEQFATAVSDCLNALGIKIDNGVEIFERSARAHGLIEVYAIPAGLMMPDRIFVRPGFNALLDYLLATEVAEKIRELTGRSSSQFTREEVFPPALRGRSNVGALVVAMLLKDGISVLGLELWRDSVRQQELEAWHARAICDLLPEQAAEYKEWVSRILRRDMIACRMLVAELILPSSRVPAATFGAEFLHGEFTRMSLTERDLLWSGPDWLPNNCGGTWEGNGLPVHDSITLDDEDSAVSVPILAVWVTSSVIRERQRQAIAHLAKWGSKRPAELAKLLLNFAAVDDVQVMESVTVAAAGAVLELVKHGAADDLAKAAHEIFFEKREEKDHPSVVARHAARLVIERAFSIGTELPTSIHSDATPPYAPVGAKLSIDAETVVNTLGEEQHGGGFPLSSDLDWYVAKKARDPFFKQARRRFGEPTVGRFANVPNQILAAVADGNSGLDPEVMSEIQEEIERNEERLQQFSISGIHPIIRVVDAGTGEETNEKEPRQESPTPGDAEDTPASLTLEGILRVFPTVYHSQPPPQFSPEAEALLADYAQDASAGQPLNPRQLGNGLIAALYKEWGWNKEMFYGKPNGGKSGEILGADIAILRQHSPSRHGSRSPVAMFAEKYVWSAVNVVSSFLCDRLPGKDDTDDGWEMINNQSNLGSGMPDPLAGFRPDEDAEYRPLWNPAGLAPTPDLTEKRQPDRGIQWLNLADWPDPVDWFAAGEDEPILLSGFLSTDDHSIGVQIAVWVSCIAVPKALFSLIERDIEIAPDLWTSSFSVHNLEGSFGNGVYSPPRLAVWTPWVTDDKTETWCTLSNSGQPVAIPLLPLVTETHWEGTEGETSALSPSKLLRVAGEIIDCQGTDDALQFVGRDRAEVAYYQRARFPDDWNKFNQHLQIDRTKFFDALAEQDLVPVWGVRLYRELLPELRANGWVDQDSYWLVVSEDDGGTFRSVLVARENRNR
jgi:hypothetical protein